MSLTLTPNQLFELSGYRRRADIIRWLNENGIPYTPRRDGSPALTLAMFEQASASHAKPVEPDFGALAK